MKRLQDAGAEITTKQLARSFRRRPLATSALLLVGLVPAVASAQTSTPGTAAAPASPPQSAAATSASFSVDDGAASDATAAAKVAPGATDAPAVVEPTAAKPSAATPAVAQSTPAEPRPVIYAASAPIPSYAGARATHKASPSPSELYAQTPYMQRYLPEANLWEVGMFAGLLFPSPAHNLKVQVLPREEYSPLALQLGGRLAYFPLRWLGIEAEAFGAGGSLETSQYSAVFYSIRAHALLQLPIASVVPFVLVGAGALGASSETMGHDRDGEFHFGAGVKVPMNHRVSGRFDFRDMMSQKGNGAANGKQTHYPELHLGVTFTFDRTPPAAAPMPDRDYDGLYDSEDRCPDEGALTSDGCAPDSDGDSLVDPKDECPQVAGPMPTGCPNLDEDADGVPVPTDACPAEAASTKDGCPELDGDADGFMGAADKCPKEPENLNGYEDKDGCPDQMPEAVSRFMGVIPGINFKQGTAVIEASSHTSLDGAAEILQKYETIKIEVSGHTSSEGKESRNQELSEQRAEAVRTYLTGKGVAADRVTARGAGASEPVADNGTKAGREQNRRIEFRVVSQP